MRGPSTQSRQPHVLRSNLALFCKGPSEVSAVQLRVQALVYRLVRDMLLQLGLRLLGVKTSAALEQELDDVATKHCSPGSYKSGTSTGAFLMGLRDGLQWVLCANTPRSTCCTHISAGRSQFAARKANCLRSLDAQPEESCA